MTQMNKIEFIRISICPICSTSRRKRLGLRGDRPIKHLPKSTKTEITVDVWVCKNCKHVWVDPCPNEATLSKFYELQSERYFEHFVESDLDTSDFFLFLNDNATSLGSLLDIGCGEGRILKSAKGWIAKGVETTPSFAVKASEFVEVFPSMEMVTGTFDAITIMNVLEHVANPLALMQKAFEVGNPGALLFVSVPNAHRVDAWLMDLLLRLSCRPWTV